MTTTLTTPGRHHPMSGRIVGEVLEHAPEDLTTAQLLVLVAIAEDAHDKTRRSTYSDVKTIVRKTRLRPGTVRNALTELTGRALITPCLDRVKRGGHHQEYAIACLSAHHRASTRDTA